ncbi:MAG: sigma factor-like helix-turn-helix DNA-binding protein [bacterium]|nr:sigma factor-like helix-turn-helix DNA-binding protein [bacterium]
MKKVLTNGELLLVESILGEYVLREEVMAPKNTARLKRALIKVISLLDERERIIVELRVGLVDGRPRTFREIGEQFKVTGTRIRQIVAKAMRKARHPTRIHFLDGFYS